MSIYKEIKGDISRDKKGILDGTIHMISHEVKRLIDI